MIWSTIILCGLITFLIRFIPLSGMLSRELSPLLKNSFKYIPLAVLTPIIVNDLSIIQNNNFYLLDNYKLIKVLLQYIKVLYPIVVAKHKVLTRRARPAMVCRPLRTILSQRGCSQPYITWDQHSVTLFQATTFSHESQISSSDRETRGDELTNLK